VSGLIVVLMIQSFFIQEESTILLQAALPIGNISVRAPQGVRITRNAASVAL
jgi:hypothetical protein